MLKTGVVTKESIISLSIPISAGLKKIERAIMALETMFPRIDWNFGNINDPDNNRPLNWWGEPERLSIELISRTKPSGENVLDEVVCERAGNGYILVYSPALVKGVAADDEILVDHSTHTFQVIRRGGNVAVHLFTKHDPEICRLNILPQVGLLGGWLDGFFTSSIGGEIVFSIPELAGLDRIEQVFNTFTKTELGTSWKFYNV